MYVEKNSITIPVTINIIIASLSFGNILINTVHYSIQLPHGGLKQSGFGKDIGHHSLADYYDLKRISIKR